ncbi:MAG: hypothetical protein AAB456_02370 [Patescibacteria group bacterium]
MAVSNLEFVKLRASVATPAEFAAKLGCKVTTVTQRMTQLRKNGWVIPEFTRGGGGGRPSTSKAPSLEDLRAIAEFSGKTLEQVQAESVATITKVIEAGERIKAGKAAVRVAVPATDTVSLTDVAS